MTTNRSRTTDVDKILQSLGPLPPPRPHPALVLIAGLPGTGKSVFSGELKQRTGAVILQSDAIRRLLVQRPTYAWSESRRLFNALHATVEKLLDACISCIVDATNLTEAYRQPLYEIAEKRGAKAIVVEVTAPEEVVIARLSGRTAESVSEADVAVYERMRPRWEAIWREHFIVDTSKTTERALRAVARAMEDS